MKNKLLLLAGLFLIISVSSFKADLSKDRKKTTYPYQIGYFSVNGQQYDAYGDGGGHVAAVFATDGNFNDVALVNSWSGTYTTAHQINVTFKLTAGGTPLAFAGYCLF